MDEATVTWLRKRIDERFYAEGPGVQLGAFAMCKEFAERLEAEARATALALCDALRERCADEGDQERRAAEERDGGPARPHTDPAWRNYERGCAKGAYWTAKHIRAIDLGKWLASRIDGGAPAFTPTGARASSSWPGVVPTAQMVEGFEGVLDRPREPMPAAPPPQGTWYRPPPDIEPARRRLALVLPHVVLAVEMARQDGEPGIAIVGTKPGGHGQIVASFSAVEFLQDLFALLVGAAGK